MTAKYIAFDCESGGLDPEKSSLLTVYFAILNDKLEVIDELDLKFKPDGTHYSVTPEALMVNKIDLIALDEEGIDIKSGEAALTELITTHSDNGKRKLIPLGHNINFDIAFITQKLIRKNKWEYFVSYRNICTAVVMRYLVDAGVLPNTISGGLESIAKYFEIDYSGAHNAKFDTLLTVAVYKQLLATLIGLGSRKEV